MTYEEAVERIKICGIFNDGLSDPDNISCIKCDAKSLCMKYTSNDTLKTLKKKYIIKYSCKCGHCSKLSDVICPLCGTKVEYIGIFKLKEEKQMSEMTKVDINTDKDGNETWEVDVEGSIPKAIVLGKIHQSIITAEKEFCSETPTVVINGQSTINPRHYAIMDKLTTLKDLEKYILGY